MIDPKYAANFDHVIDQRGSHAGKLNHLACEIARHADDDDLIMFLDGDAFPIADPMPLITQSLKQAPLVAVRRAENVNEPQPHPCFCVTTVGTWRTLPGDWSEGPTWPGPKGEPESDVGAQLLRRLQLSDTPWVEVLRSNRRNPHALYFAIYGDVIYHHGAGFRTSALARVDRENAPAALPCPSMAFPAAIMRRANRERQRHYEYLTKRRTNRQSRRLYNRIRAGDDRWLQELMS